VASVTCGTQGRVGTVSGGANPETPAVPESSGSTGSVTYDVLAVAAVAPGPGVGPAPVGLLATWWAGAPDAVDAAGIVEPMALVPGAAAV